MLEENELLSHRADQLMPTEEKALQVLRLRAKQFAKGVTEKNTEESFIHFIKFTLGENEKYGIPFEKLKEVVHELPITKVPYMPGYVSGVVNNRGLMLTVINLSDYFNLKTRQAKHESTTNEIIIVKHGDMIIGFKVINILGSSAYQSSMLEIFQRRVRSMKAQHVFGLHQGDTTILNIDAICSDLARELHQSK